MKLPRRNFLHLAAGAAALPTLSRIAWTESYPSRPVRVIVPFAPAGTTDIAARLMGQWLSEHLGQQFVIENRPGASTTIGTEVVVRAPADGYTLLLATPSSAINATLFEKLSYNFLHDIVPIAGIFRVPNVMVVHPSVPAKTVPEFIAYAKANPGKINVESTGAGTSNHLAGELFKLMTGVDMVHIQYRGSGPALIDLLAGQVQVGFDTMPGLMPANFTTFAHFSVSSAMSLPKSAGEPASTVPPRSTSRAFMLGSARPALISLFSFSTILAGVSLGAPMPYHALDS